MATAVHSIFVCACLYLRTYIFHTCMYFWLVMHIVCTGCTVTFVICHTHTLGFMYRLYSHLHHLSHTYTWVDVQFVQSPLSSVTHIHLGLCTVCTVTFTICHTRTLWLMYSLYSHLCHLSHTFTLAFMYSSCTHLLSHVSLGNPM